MALIRAGLAACISLERDIEVVAELDRREPVLPTVAALRPDVAVIDDGIAADDRIGDPGRWFVGRRPLLKAALGARLFPSDDLIDTGGPS